MFAVILRGCFTASIFLSMLALGARFQLQAQTANVPPNKLSFDVGPAPPWVKQIEPPSDAAVGADPSGMVYLLVDRQENVDKSAYYYHEVRKITSEKAVHDGASIAPLFDPTFQRLTFHSITLRRNGIVSNRLDRSRIQLLPREKDPEQSIYDRSYSAQTVLEEARVGDVIEFALTREGVNPVMRGKYSKLFLLQWEALIVQNVFGLIYPAGRNLVFRAENGARQPTVTTANGGRELWYEDHNVPGRIIEDDVPNDYEPRQRLDISGFHDWAEFVEWAIPIFDTGAKRSAEFEVQIEKLSSIADPEQRVVSALQFVQDKIRYVKLRSLLDALPLASPAEILRRGFANRIEKALLLVALLRGSNIDAAPALVSDTFRAAVPELLPSTDIVDDAIVQVRLGEKTYWLNPATSDQHGPLSQIYVPQYGYAVVLRPGTTELTPFQPPPGSFPVKKVVENFRVPPPDKVAELEVISEYHGRAADRTRALFRENTPQEIQKNFLEFYTRTFPDAKPQKQPWYEEIPGENACRVTEWYVIPRLWQLNDERSRYFLTLEPVEVYSAFGSTISPERADPIGRDYPNTITEELNVEMFEDWPLDVTSQTLESEFFRVRDEPTASGSNLQFHYTYEALKDRVETSDFDKFNEEISNAKNKLGYTLRYRTQEQLKKIERLGTFNWAMGAAALCWFGTASFLAYLYFRVSKLPQPVPPPPDTPARLNGIGGWLILLAIGHILLPFRFIKTGFDAFSVTMNTSSWRSLTDPLESSYHAWWAPALLFEVFFNIGGFAFAVLLVVLFFTKKAAWPRAFALFLIFNLLGALTDTILVNRIPAARQPIFTALPEIVSTVLTAAIWIPYVFVSKRVKATFRY